MDDLTQFTRDIAKMKREIDDALRRKLPIKVGRIATDHFQQNFREGGFVNDGLHPWPATRRQRSGSKGAADNYGPLLSGRKQLYGSIKYIPGDAHVVVKTDLKYAPLHNWGGTVNPTVTPKMRKYAWARYNEVIGKKKGARQKKGKGRKYVETEEAKRWKALALTKRQKLSISIPQRQFLGESKELEEKIRNTIDKEIERILHNG